MYGGTMLPSSSTPKAGSANAGHDERALRDHGVALGPDGVPLSKASAGYIAAVLLTIAFVALGVVALAAFFN